MTNDAASATRDKRTCEFPGCSRAPRSRAGGAGGKPPIYCDLINENTGKYAHTPVTARREEQRRVRQASRNGGATTTATVKAERAGGAVGAERLATASREYAAGLLGQFQAEATALAETISAALAQLAAAVDPDVVRAELDEAHRRVERIQFETAEQVKDARQERDHATTTARQLIGDRDQALAVRDQAIDDLECAERERDEATAAARRAQADAEDAIAQARHDAEATIEEARQREAVEAARIRAETTEQITLVQRERDEVTVAASRAEALATRATDDAERLRAELADMRREHKKELTDLRAESKAALVDQAAQLRDLYEAEITRLTNQLTAITAARTPPSTEDAQGDKKPRR